MSFDKICISKCVSDDPLFVQNEKIKSEFMVSMMKYSYLANDIKNIKNKKDIDLFMKKINKPIDEYYKMISKFVKLNDKSVKTLKSRQEKNVKCIVQCSQNDIELFRNTVIGIIIMKKLLNNNKIKKSFLLLLNSFLNKESTDSANYALELLNK